MKELEVGDWILMKYGFNPKEFCVIERCDEAVRLASRTWLVSSSIWLRKYDPYLENYVYLGKGKYRWWRLLCIGFTDFILPYSRPKLNK